MLNLVSRSWNEEGLPRAWKTAISQPIPKLKETTSLRPISLLSYLVNTAEKMVLSRLK